MLLPAIVFRLTRLLGTLFVVSSRHCGCPPRSKTLILRPPGRGPDDHEYLEASASLDVGVPLNWPSVTTEAGIYHATWTAPV